MQQWAGLSGDAYREQFGDLPGELDKLERSYRLASGALDDYWPHLQTAQADADRALAQGRQARADLDAAKSRLTDADAWVKRAQDTSRQYQDDPRPGVPPPSARRGGRNAQKYTHLVRYAMEPGTRDALIAAGRGSGDNIEAIREAYGLHLDEIGQSVDFVHLKLEREGLNFGLRPGSVDVFNSRIRSMTHTLL